MWQKTEKNTQRESTAWGKKIKAAEIVNIWSAFSESIEICNHHKKEPEIIRNWRNLDSDDPYWIWCRPNNYKLALAVNYKKWEWNGIVNMHLEKVWLWWYYDQWLLPSLPLQPSFSIWYKYFKFRTNYALGDWFMWCFLKEPMIEISKQHSFGCQ